MLHGRFSVAAGAANAATGAPLAAAAHALATAAVGAAAVAAAVAAAAVAATAQALTTAAVVAAAVPAAGAPGLPVHVEPLGRRLRQLRHFAALRPARRARVQQRGLREYLRGLLHRDGPRWCAGDERRERLDWLLP